MEGIQSTADTNATIEEDVIIDDHHLDDSDDEIPLKDYLSKFKTKYRLGDLVYAELDGYPPWPAIVDLDPDLNMYFWLENNETDITHYHVTFLDTWKRQQRSWCLVEKMDLFVMPLPLEVKRFPKLKNRYLGTVKIALKVAKITNYDDRLKQYGFKPPIEKFTTKRKITGTNVKTHMAATPRIPPGANEVTHIATPRIPDTNEVTHMDTSQMSIRYQPGDIVWAKVIGYPYWPGMIDNDPELNTHFRMMTSKQDVLQMHYHIVFLDYKRLSRSWCDSKYIKVFGQEKIMVTRDHYKVHKDRFLYSVSDAYVALKLNREQRIKKFGFQNRLREPGINVISD